MNTRIKTTRRDSFPPESETVEWKQSFGEWKEIVETCAAFATGKPQHDIVPEYPEAAVREAITNALCHRSYTNVGTIQVRIHDDCLEVWNPGKLPPDLSIAELYRKHASHPRNPLLAGAVFRTRLIEQWGTGTLRIIEACRPSNIKVEFETAMGMFIVRLKKSVKGKQAVSERTAAQVTRQDIQLRNKVLQKITSYFPPATAQVAAQVIAQVAEHCREPKAGKAIMEILRLKHWKTFQTNYLNPLLNAGILERTIPGKPTSRLQKYRLTEKSREWLKENAQ